MPTHHPTDVFHSSLKRCQEAPLFFERFYDLFLRQKPEIRKKFEHVDMDRQMRMLQASLQMVMLASQPGISPEFYLGRVAARHSKKDLDIPSHLYEDWLDALLTAVAENDPKFSPEVRDVWDQVMTIGIQYMISQYEE